MSLLVLQNVLCDGLVESMSQQTALNGNKVDKKPFWRLNMATKGAKSKVGCNGARNGGSQWVAMGCNGPQWVVMGCNAKSPSNSRSASMIKAPSLIPPQSDDVIFIRRFLE